MGELRRPVATGPLVAIGMALVALGAALYAWGASLHDEAGRRALACFGAAVCAPAESGGQWQQGVGQAAIAAGVLVLIVAVVGRVRSGARP